MNPAQLYFALSHFVRRKLWTGFSLPRDALVLDVGSGDKPFWRANVFVDDLSVPDAERAGNLAPLQVGLFVDAQAESLPFDDEVFDFVFCSHLIEHSNDPKKVVSELLRVTKPDGGGYIECPNAIVEALAPFPGHRWLVYEDADRSLLFVRQSGAQHDAALRNQAYAQKVLRKLTWNGYDLFIQRSFTKKGGIECEVLDAGGGPRDYMKSKLDPDVMAGNPSPYRNIVHALRRLRSLDAPRPELQAIHAQLERRSYFRNKPDESGELCVYTRHIVAPAEAQRGGDSETASTASSPSYRGLSDQGE